MLLITNSCHPMIGTGIQSDTICRVHKICKCINPKITLMFNTLLMIRLMLSTPTNLMIMVTMSRLMVSVSMVTVCGQDGQELVPSSIFLARLLGISLVPSIMLFTLVLPLQVRMLSPRM